MNAVGDDHKRVRYRAPIVGRTLWVGIETLVFREIGKTKPRKATNNEMIRPYRVKWNLVKRLNVLPKPLHDRYQLGRALEVNTASFLEVQRNRRLNYSGK